MIELLVPENDGTESRLRVDGPTAIIGRGVNVAVRVRSGTVARHHARIMERDGRLYVEDLGSTNGTRIGGHRVGGTSGERVEVGQTIEVAERRIMVVAHEPVIRADFEVQEARFLELLTQDADDEATRHVYADSLEERGEHLRASWLRAEIASRRTRPGAEPDGARLVALEGLTEQLVAAPRWRMLVSRARIERCDQPICPKRWHALPASPGEPEQRLAMRACPACRELVTYADFTPRADSPDRLGLIAVDRLAAPRR